MVPPHKVGDTRLPTEDTSSTALKHLPLRAWLFRAEQLLDRQPLPSIDVYAYLPHDVGAMLETLKAAEHGSVANVDFGGKSDNRLSAMR
jgi:hypothetical protein